VLQPVLIYLGHRQLRLTEQRGNGNDATSLSRL
jgi:hypothetical protein